MKVCVFGGTGFIGGQVIKSLVRNGHTVSALARSQEKADFLKQLGASPAFGDLDRRETIRKVIEGSEAVVNMAFPSFLGRMTKSRMRKDRQEGLNQIRGLLEAVAEVGNIPLILTEGSMALGDSGDNWLDETSPYKFDKGHGRLLSLNVPYAQRVAEEKNLPIIKLLISGAYGAGSWFKESVYGLMKKGRFRIFGDGQNVWSFLHVEDVAEAYRLAVEKLPIGKSFILADDEPCKYVDFANFVAGQLGKPSVKFLPKWMGNIFLGSVLCEALTMNTRSRNTKAKKELDWKLRYPTYREGIPATLAQIEQSGDLR